MWRLALLALLLPVAVQAQTQAPSGTVRPRGEPAQQSSVPTPAPPAGTGNTTGATNQDPGVKAMNEAEKNKVGAHGK